MNVVAAVVYCWAPLAVVEEEFRGDGGQRLAGDLFRKFANPPANRTPAGLEQIEYRRGYTDARRLNQLEGLAYDALHECRIEKFNFRSHTDSTVTGVALCAMSVWARATAAIASLA